MERCGSKTRSRWIEDDNFSELDMLFWTPQYGGSVLTLMDFGMCHLLSGMG